MTTVLIKRNRVEPIGYDDLFEPDAPPLSPRPSAWNGPHVAMRITEGFETLRAMLVRDYSTKTRTAWPAHMYEFEDLLAQQEQGELEKTMQEKNRTRVSPTVADIARADCVLYWPVQYLNRLHPQLCEAVNAVALAHSLGLDSGWVTRKRGGYADTWRNRHDEGCELIASGLGKDRVSVF
jgi:hypothetical protein